MRRSIPNAARFALVLPLALAAAGCGRGITSTPGDAPNLQQWVDGIKAKPAPPLDPLPVMQQFETFEYSAQTLRDPFSTAFAPGSSAAGPRPDDGRPKQALEQFPLDSLKMVGTIGTRGSLVALVMGPDKVTQRVVPGNYMGQSDGRVTGVYEDRIELVELVSDGAGGWLERPATVSLDDE